MANAFQPAKKYRARLRLALAGPSGSGKTYSALAIASGMGEKIAVVDTEHGSASMYADRFTFDVMELDSYAMENYIAAIADAERAGYDVLVIDSLSHAWAGKDGALEQVDRAAARSKSGNNFTAWREVTPKHNRLIDAITGAKLHIIATMRSKTEYVLVEKQRGDRKVQEPQKVGMAPVQRDGMEYEFSLFGEMNAEHALTVTKSRIGELQDAYVEKPGAELGSQLIGWLSGEEPPALPTQNGAQAHVDAQQAALINAALRSWSEKDANGVKSFVGVLLASYPYARGQDGKFSAARLTAKDAGMVERLLEDALEKAIAAE